MKVADLAERVAALESVIETMRKDVDETVVASGVAHNRRQRKLDAELRAQGAKVREQQERERAALLERFWAEHPIEPCVRVEIASRQVSTVATETIELDERPPKALAPLCYQSFGVEVWQLAAFGLSAGGYHETPRSTWNARLEVDGRLREILESGILAVTEIDDEERCAAIVKKTHGWGEGRWMDPRRRAKTRAEVGTYVEEFVE